MGYGDEIMASGLARGAHLRGKRVAFGDGRRIHWSHASYHIFANNPNIAAPGAEKRNVELEWIPFYQTSRGYAKRVPGGWEWNLDFHATPGELFFKEQEIERGR